MTDPPELPLVTKRRWGYIVWGVALGFVFVPELLAAWHTTEKHLPFTTISAMVGHLEFENALWEIAPTALVVLALYSLLRVPPVETSGGHTPEKLAERDIPHRTAGGRITFEPSKDSAKPAETFDNETASIVFALVTVAVMGAIAFATVWTRDHWPSPTPPAGQSTIDFHVGYVLYGSIGVLWLAVPSLVAVFWGKDAPFPTLFRTSDNLQEWLDAHRGNLPGKVVAWIFPYVLVWGLVFMLIHLTLYPYPDITHLLNPTGQ